MRGLKLRYYHKIKNIPLLKALHLKRFGVNYEEKTSVFLLIDNTLNILRYSYYDDCLFCLYICCSEIDIENYLRF